MSEDRTRLEAELAKLEQALSAQEALRGILPDEQLEATLAALQEKCASIQATLAGARGVAVGGDVEAPIVTGDGSIAAGGHVVVAQDGARVSIGDESAAAAEAERQSALARYLRTLISRCDPLDLVQIDEALPRDAEPVRISDVFTTLYLERVSRTQEQTVEEAISQRHAADRAMKRGREERDTEPDPALRVKVWDELALRIQAVEAVGALPRLVILGRPGGGKSTLVNHVATQLARRRLGQAVGNEVLPGWPAGEQPLPVRIVLRRFAAWLPPGLKRGEAGLVWDYLAHQLGQWGCKEARDPLKRALTEEGGIVLFDGLDEVRETDVEAKRTLITEAIARFAAPLEKCRVVVTCRQHAYEQGDAWRLPGAEFPDVELALFNLEQVEAFTRTWYRVVGPSKGWDEVKCEVEAGNLFAAVQTSPHLQELSRYPLLLTLMAQVHGRDGTLPQDRADLYERVVNLLLAHWENRIVRDVEGERRLEPGLVMQLGVRTETLRAALERVAFDAHERQEREEDRDERAAGIPREDLRQALRADLGSLDRAEQVITYVQERAGLLQAIGNRTYEFPHRTFQEYLAATHLLKQGQFDTMLRDRIRRDRAWWQEVFLLAAGASRGTPRNVSDLVDCLLQPAPDSPVQPDKAGQARLAAQALWETGFAAHVRKEEESEPGRFSSTYQRVQDWLMAALRSDTSLTPRERAASGAALARLGDPRPEVTTIEGMQFCCVPPGPFWMGSEEYDDQKPVHLNEHLDYGYWLARYPVTVAQFRSFVEAGGYWEARYWREAQAAGVWNPRSGQVKVKGYPGPEPRDRPYDFGEPFNLPNHPVVGVTWYEALAFARWLEDELHRDARLGGDWAVRLPSEAEWEKAARGGLEVPDRPAIVRVGAQGPAPLRENRRPKRLYPWGDEPDLNRANYDEAGIDTTSPVGCFPDGASPYGVEDLVGNVWEWTRSLWGESWEEPEFRYPYDPEDGREDLEAGNDTHRVYRGGAFKNIREVVRCAYRFWGSPNFRYRNIGFRVVVAPVSL